MKTTAGTLACLLSARGLSAWEIGRQTASSGPPVKLAIIGLQYLAERPVAITGTGAVATWRDGRAIPDAAACLIEFPRAPVSYRATVASSFGGNSGMVA